MVSAGHRLYVEEKINGIVGRPFLLGQRLAANKLHSTLELNASVGLCLFALVLISANSISTAWQHFPQFITAPVTGLNAAALFMSA